MDDRDRRQWDDLSTFSIEDLQQELNRRRALSESRRGEERGRENDGDVPAVGNTAEPPADNPRLNNENTSNSSNSQETDGYTGASSSGTNSDNDNNNSSSAPVSFSPVDVSEVQNIDVETNNSQFANESIITVEPASYLQILSDLQTTVNELVGSVATLSESYNKIVPIFDNLNSQINSDSISSVNIVEPVNRFSNDDLIAFKLREVM